MFTGDRQMNRKAILFTLAAFTASAMGQAALAVGEDDSEPPKKTKTTPQCKNGQVWDAKRNRCVEAKRSDLSDDILFDAARELAYAEQYENAIKVLGAMREQQSARVLNYLGYANRKAGRMELGMQYYRRALQADENYILARSYMGQAFVEQGRIEEAKVQLIEIRDRGGENTWAYQALLQSLGGVRAY
jgi:tetratricopeptide (TPR) repeat protein